MIDVDKYPGCSISYGGKDFLPEEKTMPRIETIS
jgi:hypothetical protein